MKILGVGLSKTGTTSLHRALELLGYRSLHYDDRRLNDIVFGGRDSNPDFRRYDDVDAVLDIPAAFYFEELASAYPDCRCILTIRDEDAWWDSIRAHFNEKSIVASPADDSFKWTLRRLVYGSAHAEPTLFRERYRAHNQRVRARIASDRLLVLDIAAGEGWRELCPFLGVSIPKAPFPTRNRRSDLAGRDQAVEALTRQVPASGSFILIDEWTLDLGALGDRRALPFLERDGSYWGPPPDDETGIAELERMRKQGASHLAVTRCAFWWLEHYRAFSAHLDRRYRRTFHDDNLVVYDLRG